MDELDREEILKEAPYVIEKSYEKFLAEEVLFTKLNRILDIYAQVLRYLGGILLSEYLETDKRVDKINKQINKLIRPSLGNWKNFIATYISEFEDQIFITELNDIIAKIRNKKYEINKVDIFSEETNHTGHALEVIIMFRNNLAHGVRGVNEEDAARLLRTYTPCIETILFELLPIFKKYKIVRCSGLNSDKSKYKFEYLESGVVFESAAKKDFKKDGIYLKSEDRFLLLSYIFNDIFKKSESDREKLFLYDGLTNEYINYIGVEKKRRIKEYIGLLRSKFSKKKISMEFNPRYFKYKTFKSYVTDLSQNTITSKQEAGKYIPQAYVKRRPDYELDEFMESEKNGIMIVGEAGYGKTSLLCNFTRDRIKQGDGVYFIDGASITETSNESPIFSYIKQETLLESSFNSIFELLQLIEEHKEEDNNFIIVVDAVNEAYREIETLSEIEKIITEFGARFDWLKVVVSVRKVNYDILKYKVTEEAAKSFPISLDEEYYYCLKDEQGANKEVEIKKWTISEQKKAFDKYKQKYPKSNSLNFHGLTNQLRKILQSPLNMYIFFSFVGEEDVEEINSELKLFEKYHQYITNTEDTLSKNTRNLLDKIIKKMREQKENRLDLDLVYELEAKAMRRPNRFRYSMSPYDRLKNIGILSETREDGVYYVVFVYQKYLEFLLYREIKQEGKSSEELLDTFVESIDWDKIPEIHQSIYSILKEKSYQDYLKQLFSIIMNKGHNVNKFNKTIMGLLLNEVQKEEINYWGFLEELERLDILEWSVALLKKLFDLAEIKTGEDFGETLIKIADKFSPTQKKKVYFWLGLIYQYQSKMDLSLKFLDKAAEFSATGFKAKILIQKAKTLRQDGKLAAAEKTLDLFFDNYETKDLRYASALIQTGLCKYANKKYEEALEYYWAADELAKKFGDKKLELYNLMGISTALEEEDKIEQGIEILLEVYSKADKLGYQNLYIDAMNGLARKHLLKEDYEQALYWAQEGLQLWEYANFSRGQLVMCSHIIKALSKKGADSSDIEPYIQQGRELQQIVDEKLLNEMFAESIKVYNQYH